MKRIMQGMAILVFFMLLISGCSENNTKPGVSTVDNPPAKPTELKVGYIGPMSGDVAILGIEASKAIEVAVDEVNAKGGINGRQVKLIIEDDQYDAAKTVTAYNKLVNTDGVEVIIISTYGGLFAVANLAEQDNVVLIDSLDCDEQIASELPDNVFCIAKETNDLADVIADYAIKQGYEKVGILHGTVDQFMPSVAHRFEDTVKDSGITVQYEPYVPGTVDFKSQLMKLKDNDAIVFLGYDEIGIAIKQAKNELKMDMPYLSIPSVATTPSIQEASQGAIDGMYFSFYAPLDDNEKATKFYADFKAKNDREPLVFVATDHAYDSAKILFEKGLPQATGATQAERFAQVKAALYGVSNYPGVSGTLSMQQDGRISGILIRLYQLQGMAPVHIDG